MNYRNAILVATPIAAMGAAYAFYPSGITRERLMFAGIVGLGSYIALTVVSKLTSNNQLTPTANNTSGTVSSQIAGRS